MIINYCVVMIKTIQHNYYNNYNILNITFIIKNLISYYVYWIIRTLRSTEIDVGLSLC